jgi:hypothetical protein
MKQPELAGAFRKDQDEDLSVADSVSLIRWQGGGISPERKVPFRLLRFAHGERE